VVIVVNRTRATAPAFSTSLLLFLAFCGRPPAKTTTQDPSRLDLMVRVAGTEASTDALQAIGTESNTKLAPRRSGALAGVLAWVLVERYQLTAGFALDVGGPPVALVRAVLSGGTALGLVRCESACASALDHALEDPADRARLEQTILRGTEHDRLDGVAIDLTALPALDPHAVDFVEELGAAVHVVGRKLGVIARMTCRGLECEGVRGTLARVVRAVDVLSLEELDQDVPSVEVRQKRRLLVLSAELDGAPAARVFLGVANTSDLATRVVDAGARGLGGVDVGRLGETPVCTFDLLAAWHTKRSSPPCP